MLAICVIQWSSGGVPWPRGLASVPKICTVRSGFVDSPPDVVLASGLGCTCVNGMEGSAQFGWSSVCRRLLAVTPDICSAAAQVLARGAAISCGPVAPGTIPAHIRWSQRAIRATATITTYPVRRADFSLCDEPVSSCEPCPITDSYSGPSWRAARPDMNIDCTSAAGSSRGPHTPSTLLAAEGRRPGCRSSGYFKQLELGSSGTPPAWRYSLASSITMALPGLISGSTSGR